MEDDDFNEFEKNVIQEILGDPQAMAEYSVNQIQQSYEDQLFTQEEANEIMDIVAEYQVGGITAQEFNNRVFNFFEDLNENFPDETEQGQTKEAQFDVIDARNSAAVRIIENPDGSHSIGYRGRELGRVRGATLGTTILGITRQQQGESKF